VIRDEDLPGNARRMESWFRSALALVPGVRSVTGLGLLLGVNLDRPAKPVVTSLLDAGILVGTCEADPNQIRLLPPLTLTPADAAPFPPALASLLRSA
jgi:acetylornithine/succinyldiaminopimelate/putrescine aminotransferase